MEGLVADQTIYGRRLVEIYPELLQSWHSASHSMSTLTPAKLCH